MCFQLTLSQEKFRKNCKIADVAMTHSGMLITQFRRRSCYLFRRRTPKNPTTTTNAYSGAWGFTVYPRSLRMPTSTGLNTLAPTP